MLCLENKEEHLYKRCALSNIILLHTPVMSFLVDLLPIYILVSFPVISITIVYLMKKYMDNRVTSIGIGA
jgi:hypothetical protein